MTHLATGDRTEINTNYGIVTIQHKAKDPARIEVIRLRDNHGDTHIFRENLKYVVSIDGFNGKIPERMSRDEKEVLAIVRGDLFRKAMQSFKQDDCFSEQREKMTPVQKSVIDFINAGLKIA